jgi:hypothetical protein
MKPEKNTYPDYYNLYIPLVTADNVIDGLIVNQGEVGNLILSIPDNKSQYSYAQGKWTIKQVINHITDTERIIAYRALRFARKDPQQPLAFEEDHYAANSELDNRSMADLQEEFNNVRKATLSLFKSFSEKTLMLKGNTTMGDTTVLALGYLIAGHSKHHLNVIKERYLKAV